MLLSTLASPVSGVFCSSVSGTVTRLLVVDFPGRLYKPLSGGQVDRGEHSTRKSLSQIR
jgi:hypothetical protein